MFFFKGPDVVKHSYTSTVAGSPRTLSPTVLNRETWSNDVEHVEILLHVTSSHIILGGPREPANRQAAWLMAWYLFRFAPVVGETVTPPY